MENNFINITDALKTIADNHKQIHSYGFGDLAYINTSGSIDYVLMWVKPKGSRVNRGEVGLSFEILIMDLVRKDESNLIDVLNDTHQIALDVLADIYINGLDAVNGTHGFHLKNPDIQLNNFVDRFDEEVAGWSMNITVWVGWDWNECVIPN
jgi:hypothetical protein